MSEEKLRHIFAESGHDFSAGICEGLTLDQLDLGAIEDLRRRWIAKATKAEDKQLAERLASLTHEELLTDAEANDVLGTQGTVSCKSNVPRCRPSLCHHHRPAQNRMVPQMIANKVRPTFIAQPNQNGSGFRGSSLITPALASVGPDHGISVQLTILCPLLPANSNSPGENKKTAKTKGESAMSVCIRISLVALTIGIIGSDAARGADVPERLAPAAPHGRPAAKRPTTPNVRRQPNRRIGNRPRPANARPVVRTPSRPKHVSKRTIRSTPHRILGRRPKIGPTHVRTPVRVASNPTHMSHVRPVTRTPQSAPVNNAPVGRIPRNFNDVFGGAFGTSTGPSGQVMSVGGDGRTSNRLGSFRSLSDTELEISLPNGFLLRIILQDYDPATNLASADTYLIDTMGRPNDSRSWSYRSSGRMQLPVGASPPQGAIQTRWTNFGHNLPGGGTSVSTPTAPQTLVFVP